MTRAAAPALIHAAGPEALPARTLYRILRLRSEVFVVEQACAFLDPDGRDLEASTVHIWADPSPEAPTVAAALRVVAEPGNVWRIGRVVTAAAWRRRGMASALLDRALALCGDAPIVLDAQAHLVEWYAARGFERAGPEFVEDGIAHVPLRLRLPR